MKINNINNNKFQNRTPNFRAMDPSKISGKIKPLYDAAIKNSPKATNIINEAGEKVSATKPLNLIEKGLVKFDLGHIIRKPYQAVVSKLSQSNRAFTHLMVADSIILSSFYTINSLRNKKIDKKQKPQMVINDMLTLGVSAGTSYFLEGGINKAVDAFKNKYLSKNSEYYIQQGKEVMKSGFKRFNELGDEIAKTIDSGATEESLKELTKKIKIHSKDVVNNDVLKAVKKGTSELKYPGLSALKVNSEGLKSVEESITGIIKDGIAKGLDKETIVNGAKEAAKGLYTKIAATKDVDVLSKGIGKLKTLIVFGLIYRYLGPVLVTPIANKLSAKFFDHKDDDKKEQVQKK